MLQSMDNKVILVGGFHEIIELCEDNDIEIAGIIDNYLTNDTYWGYPIIGTDDKAKVLFETYKNVPVLITPDVPHVRYKLYHYYKSIGFQVASLISRDHPVRLNTPERPIVNQYCEGKVKSTSNRRVK